MRSMYARAQSSIAAEVAAVSLGGAGLPEPPERAAAALGVVQALTSTTRPWASEQAPYLPWRHCASSRLCSGLAVRTCTLYRELAAEVESRVSTCPCNKKSNPILYTVVDIFFCIDVHLHAPNTPRATDNRVTAASRASPKKTSSVAPSSGPAVSMPAAGPRRGATSAPHPNGRSETRVRRRGSCGPCTPWRTRR